MKAALFAVGAVLIWLAAQALVQTIEADTEARIAQAGAYRDGCLPAPGETAVVVSDGRTARCRIYSNKSPHRGMVPQLVSAAAVEVMP